MFLVFDILRGHTRLPQHFNDLFGLVVNVFRRVVVVVVGVAHLSKLCVFATTRIFKAARRASGAIGRQPQHSATRGASLLANNSVLGAATSPAPAFFYREPLVLLLCFDI